MNHIKYDKSKSDRTTPAAILAAAKAVKPREVYYFAADYVEAIAELYDKKRWSFREITEWLNASGVTIGKGSITRVYHERRRKLKKT